MERIVRYGRRWAPLHELMGVDLRQLSMVPQELQQQWYGYHIERNMLAFPEDKKPEGFASFRYHAERMSNYLWGDPDGLWYFEFNPNAVEIIETFSQLNDENGRWLGAAGCKNSSKTEVGVWLAVTPFLIDPANTKVLVGSKTIETALGKIWASIDLAWRAAAAFLGGEHMMPGEMVLSKALIRSRMVGRKSGIEVIPGEASSIKKSAEKLQGYKAAGWKGRLFFITDETATMSPAVINTAISNLTGNPGFRGYAAFNPDEEHDASRPIAEPIGGFSTISVADKKWKTPLGWCLHFDGEQSPNVLEGRLSCPTRLPNGRLVPAGEYRWRGLYTRENLKEDTDFYIEKSSSYWKFVRGFWPPTGSDECIYSDPEIRSYGGDDICMFISPPTKVASCDPSWKHGGDRAVAKLGLCGMIQGKYKPIMALQYTETLILAEDADMDMGKGEQVALAFIEACQKRGVSIENTAFDGTGGGGPWGEILAIRWGAGSLEVQFGGEPSDLPVSTVQGELSAKERYCDMVSELWHVGKNFLRSGQLKGIDEAMAAEMTKRHYKEQGGKVKVESKKEMKKRTGKSPDNSDAAFVLLMLCRKRLGLVPAERSAPRPPKPHNPHPHEFQFTQYQAKGSSEFRQLAKRFDFRRKSH